MLVLAGVCLLVGGIGIANIAAVAVVERTGEIGLRRALGATRGEISLQFLTESLMLGIAGAVVGATIGVVLVAAVSWWNHWTAVLDGGMVAAALAAGAVSGLLAGLYPARRAARVEPVEALRR